MEHSISYIPDLIEDVRIKCQEELEETHEQEIIDLLENCIDALKKLENSFSEINAGAITFDFNLPSGEGA